MKKLILLLLVVLSLSVKAAPSYQAYANLLQSETYLQLVSSQAKWYAREVINNTPTPGTSQEIAIYQFAHDVLSAKWNSPTIYKIASYVTNETYMGNLSDWQQMGGDILTALQGVSGVQYFGSRCTNYASRRLN